MATNLSNLQKHAAPLCSSGVSYTWTDDAGSCLSGLQRAQEVNERGNSLGLETENRSSPCDQVSIAPSLCFKRSQYRVLARSLFQYLAQGGDAPRSYPKKETHGLDTCKPRMKQTASASLMRLRSIFILVVLVCQLGLNHDKNGALIPIFASYTKPVQASTR